MVIIAIIQTSFNASTGLYAARVEPAEPAVTVILALIWILLRVLIPVEHSLASENFVVLMRADK